MTLSTTVTSSVIKTNYTDFDPLVDTSVTVKIKGIRFLEDEGLDVSSGKVPLALTKNLPNLLIKKLLNRNTYNALSADEIPDFFVKVFINDVEFTSNVWEDTKFIYDISWSATLNVDDEEEFVDIKIQLIDSFDGQNANGAPCDISPDSGSSEEGYDAEIVYSIKTGHWTGDDELNDPSGYGRLCGCDDGTIYKKDLDCELWFDITQNDYDNDGIPYWTEVNEYGTDPEVENSGDPDNDKIPVEWEWKWNYDPFTSDNHETLDPDGDSINNYEEYLTSDWFSDPYRKDVFVELDIMGEGPNGEISYFPQNSKELIESSFDRQNIVLHIDYGTMGGTDILPFEADVGSRELREIYTDYFLHGDNNNWRRGVFHYGVVVYTSESAAGYMYRANAFQVSSRGHEKLAQEKGIDREIVYGSAYMHELGHTFAFWPIPGHNHNSVYPWQAGYWINRPYQSCMNYQWMYKFVDYSDGTHGGVDIDDWERIDYDAFEREW